MAVKSTCPTITRIDVDTSTLSPGHVFHETDWRGKCHEFVFLGPEVVQELGESTNSYYNKHMRVAPLPRNGSIPMRHNYGWMRPDAKELHFGEMLEPTKFSKAIRNRNP